MRGESPYASHLLYTQPGVLRDHIESERDHGVAAGWAWHEKADAVILYTDRGISFGMFLAESSAKRDGLPVEYRSLTDTPERVRSD